MMEEKQDQIQDFSNSLTRSEQEVYFRELYARHFPRIKSYILRNSGSADDAKDIFQETMIIFFEKLREPKFTISSSHGTFLFAIAKNTWLNRLRKSRKINSDEILDDLADLEPNDIEVENESIIARLLNLITFHCKQIIRSIFFIQEPMSALAGRMGWKNKHTADNQKYKCIQQLKKATAK